MHFLLWKEDSSINGNPKVAKLLRQSYGSDFFISIIGGTADKCFYEDLFGFFLRGIIGGTHVNPKVAKLLRQSYGSDVFITTIFR